MAASYLFDSDGLVALARYVAPDTLFAFDLDGTLTPIVDDCFAAQSDEPVRATLKRMAELAKVAVITGRSRKDALTILGMEPHLLVGNHGAEWPVGSESRNQPFVMNAFTKGEALMAAMARFGLERAVYFGDDITDEEVFELKGIDLFGIHIGNNGQTAAPYYLTKPSALLGLLNSMVGMLELQRNEGLAL